MSKETKKPRMAITTDFYNEEVYEGLKQMATLSPQKKASKFFRHILTDYYEKNKDRITAAIESAK